ncbi:MAG: hypothetical protein ACLU5E_09845 [Anaerovoracaceae bacterium]
MQKAAAPYLLRCGSFYISIVYQQQHVQLSEHEHSLPQQSVQQFEHSHPHPQLCLCDPVRHEDELHLCEVHDDDMLNALLHPQPQLLFVMQLQFII